MCIRDSINAEYGAVGLWHVVVARFEPALRVVEGMSHAARKSVRRAPQVDNSGADLLSVVTTLEAHKAVYEAEIEEIEKDLRELLRMTELYGNFWEKPIYSLKRLGANRRNLIKDVNIQMELFNLHLNKGRELCRKLARMPVRVVQQQDGLTPSELTIECESPILANTHASLAAMQLQPR
eukprot:TRINITY_DN12217_c0_g2_i1.p1 TRINITY_DN12217_c0_g2~~TRINITY_DN12217_c0_g2_i1.p1  ORF type:complete len:190 (+),score=46.68 TRINITY_DN12217_c0_g2_i1:33-572(+)